MSTVTPEQLVAAANVYEAKVAEADEARGELYSLILDAEQPIREIATLTRLSPGRVHQVKHGK